MLTRKSAPPTSQNPGLSEPPPDECPGVWLYRKKSAGIPGFGVDQAKSRMLRKGLFSGGRNIRDFGLENGEKEAIGKLGVGKHLWGGRSPGVSPVADPPSAVPCTRIGQVAWSAGGKPAGKRGCGAPRRPGKPAVCGVVRATRRPVPRARTPLERESDCVCRGRLETDHTASRESSPSCARSESGSVHSGQQRRRRSRLRTRLRVRCKP